MSKRALEEAARQNRFLLIAAGNAPNCLIEIRRDNVELFNERERARSFPRRGNQTAAGEIAKHLNGHVLANAQCGKNRFCRTVGTERKNAGIEGAARCSDFDR